MDPRDKANTLGQLSSTYRAQFIEGRKYEWKVFFTPISFYILTIVASFQNKIPVFSIFWVKVGVSIILGLLLLITLFYLGFVHMALNRNKEIAENCENAMQDIMNDKEIGELNVYKFQRYFVSWRTFRKGKSGTIPYKWQSLTLITFCFGCVVLLWLG